VSRPKRVGKEESDGWRDAAGAAESEAEVGCRTAAADGVEERGHWRKGRGRVEIGRVAGPAAVGEERESIKGVVVEVD
jgi:hypothetical protein